MCLTLVQTSIISTQMNFILTCLVILSLISGPVFAHSGDANCYDGNANQQDTVCKQQTSDNANLGTAASHCCLCVHVASLSGHATSYVAIVTRQILMPMQDVTVTDYKLPPLLEPPSRV